MIPKSKLDELISKARSTESFNEIISIGNESHWTEDSWLGGIIEDEYFSNAYEKSLQELRDAAELFVQEYDENRNELEEMMKEGVN